jgi:hypothetical protein
MKAGLIPIADVSVGDWIGERLGGPFGTVGSVVPRGFAAHARILHPVELDDSRTSLIDVLAPATGGQDCCLLFRGPLGAALDMGWPGSPAGFEPQSPSLLWPADRSWRVGTEIDLEFTPCSADLGIRSAECSPPPA